MDARTATSEEGRDAELDTSGERVVRVIAVGNRMHIAAKETECRTELERIVGLAAPHIASDGPTLVVLGELLGLPAALAGPRGLLARHARSSRTALTLLALAHARRILAYRLRWPGISLARALLLALTDALYRPFLETLSEQARRHGVFLVATTLAPRVRRSTDPRAIRRWGSPGASAVYLPEGPDVYNAALVFGPDGALLGRVNKVNLTHNERETLDLTPGRLAEVRVISTAAGRLGVAISLDAFTPDYLRHLDAQAAEIVVQNDANDAPWAGPGSASDWQPQEWLDSVLGALQPPYRSLRYNVCAMQTGNFFDLVFDGQSSITARASTGHGEWASTGRPYEPSRGFIGVDDYVPTATSGPLLGEFLACAPWVEEDPGIAEPRLTLDQRRRWLAAIARELRPGGARVNQYRESVVSADVMVMAEPAAKS
ncbi:MAG TPA: carbon-nitrogen hydrolase family protein [Ktedonobacterales bacterium]